MWESACGYFKEKHSKQRKQPEEKPWRRIMPGKFKEQEKGQSGGSRVRNGMSERYGQRSNGAGFSETTL